MAAELGVDKIFGRGTTPRQVASYLVHAVTAGLAVQDAPAGVAR
jgi:beta-lysine 5,6-aminomutase beta subunit